METFSRGTLLLDPWYVTGFVEGEGAFTYSRNGPRLLNLYFAVKLTDSDSAILHAMQAFFGGRGSIYGVKPRPALTPSSGYTKAACYYRVCRLDQLPHIVTHFDTYPLQGTKARSYAIWREMVQLKVSHYRRPPPERMNELARMLSAATPRNQPWK